jgi:hypothetical protein
LVRLDCVQNERYTLDDGFGTSKVQEITLPIGIPGFDPTVTSRTSTKKDNDTTLLVVIGTRAPQAARTPSTQFQLPLTAQGRELPGEWTAHAHLESTRHLR